ncbi:MAG: accessory factor UbiK family protein [Gammaproteobacteria bacterium]
MLKQQIESLLNDVASVLPNDLNQARHELESNVRAALTASLARLDLVTREEFDIQAALLQRSRAQLEQLQERLAELEKQFEEKEKE